MDIVRTVYKYDFWQDLWPPHAVKKVVQIREDYSVGNAITDGSMDIGLSMMLKLKLQSQYAGIKTGKMTSVRADGTVIMARMSYGNNTITVIPPDQKKEIVVELGGENIILYLVKNITEFRYFLINLISGKSKEILPTPVKFWRDEDFYQGPWTADFTGGFGSGTAASINEHNNEAEPLSLNTITHAKWNIVEDDNFNLMGLSYFPVFITMNVPGAGTHAGLGPDNCFDYPLCFSAIIPQNSCAFCWVPWYMHGTLPVTGQTFNITEKVMVPILKDTGQLDSDDKPIIEMEWQKKDQVWSRGAVSGTPRVDISGKKNYTVTKDEKTGIDAASSYRESIYIIGGAGDNINTGTWWNTWNAVLHMYQPCWVDISVGFGGDGAGWYPFWNWLHETPTTGIAGWEAYAWLIWGGNTRSAQGYGMHYLEPNPDDINGPLITKSIVLTGLKESLHVNTGPCNASSTSENQPTGGCSYLWGTIDTAFASGSYSGKYFFPAATLGGKKFIYFENTFAGSNAQTAYRHSGGFVNYNLNSPECYNIGPCCTAIGWYCFGLCPDCAKHPPSITTQGSRLSRSGTQVHGFSLKQEFKVGKVKSDEGDIEDLAVIDTAYQTYSHTFSGGTIYDSGVTAYVEWPQSSCDPGIYGFLPVCPCNGAPVYIAPTSFSCNEIDTYTRDVTHFEVVEYDSNPFNDSYAILYKKVIVKHTCSTSGCNSTTWIHNGTRVVTWWLYVNVKDHPPFKVQLGPICTISRLGAETGSQTCAGTRLYGGSLQINNGHLAFAYTEESFSKLGEGFNHIIGQTIYPGPINLEDRNVEPYYDQNGKLVWDNIGVEWLPKTYHYGIVRIGGKVNTPLSKQEFTIDMVAEQAATSSDDKGKRVYTVGLLNDSRSIPKEE